MMEKGYNSREGLGLDWLDMDEIDAVNPVEHCQVMLSQADSPLLSDNPRQITLGIKKDSVKSEQELVGTTDENLMLLDGYEYCENQSNGSSSVNSQCPKKIKPVKHPSLKLKSPIAYRRDSDMSVIPIKREGMAVCEKCGAIGVKHAFYTKERRFCSLACARGYSEMEKSGQPIVKPEPVLKFPPEPTLTTPVRIAPKNLSNEEEIVAPTVKRNRIDLSNTYDWKSLLSEPGFVAAPVSCFYHAPMSDCWDNITVGMKVEVENSDCENFSEVFPDSFWVATTIKIAGYKALLRYEGFGQDSSKDFWVSLCSEKVHPVGWCATKGKPLIPPKTIQNKYGDWKEFLVKRLTGARTLPSNFYNKVQDSLKSCFRRGVNLEVVDKNRISQLKVATVKEIIGHRLHIRYKDSPEDDGFWCHEASPLLHPVGWAQTVGHEISASKEYKEKCSEGFYERLDSKPDMFMEVKIPMTSHKFKEGMKLEAIDPLNLSSVCVATVTKVLRDNYIMIRIDGYESDGTGSDWFCYHASSPCIFPAGFCELNSIPLKAPKGFEGIFKWFDYLQETKSTAAPVALFNRDIPNHGFKVGMRVEAADLMDPRLICVGTISRVVGRLLKIHFDGWPEEYDQWLDCESPDIYPVGWCQLVGHKLEGPRLSALPSKRERKKPKRRYRKIRSATLFLGKRKKKKKSLSLLPQGNQEGSSSFCVKDEVSDETSSGVVSLQSHDSENSEESWNFEKGLSTVAATASTMLKPSLPKERAAISYFQNTGANTSGKTIPRLVDSPGVKDGKTKDHSVITPELWNVFDVAQFLRINDCVAYCDSFSKKKIDGKKLLTLTKDQIINLTGMKVGPSLKIFDLIQQLKVKVNPAQARFQATLKKS